MSEFRLSTQRKWQCRCLSCHVSFRRLIRFFVHIVIIASQWSDNDCDYAKLQAESEWSSWWWRWPPRINVSKADDGGERDFLRQFALSADSLWWWNDWESWLSSTSSFFLYVRQILLRFARDLTEKLRHQVSVVRVSGEEIETKLKAIKKNSNRRDARVFSCWRKVYDDDYERTLMNDERWQQMARMNDLVN